MFKLENIFQKKKVVTVSCLMMIIMAFSPCFSFADAKICKEESVYVITKDNGHEEKIIVSDHLVNNAKAQKINDVSDLIDIENVKGEEKFEQNGANFTWNAEGNDIFYQGSTIKKSPIKMNIKYYIDGEEFSGKEIQGKKGNFKISLDYENTALIDGTKVPFVVVSTMLMDNKKFSDIKIKGGKVINNGDKTIVAGMAMPDIKESMRDMAKKVSKDFDFSDSIEISGVTSGFDVTDIMSVATTTPADIEVSDFEEIDYDTEINQLDKGTRKLIEGSKKLQNGIYALDKKAPALANGVGQISGGLSALDKKAPALVTGVGQISGGLNTLNGSVKTLGDGVTQLKTLSGNIVSMLTPYTTNANKETTAKTESNEFTKTNKLLDELEENGDITKEASEKIKKEIQEDTSSAENTKAPRLKADSTMIQIKAMASALNENLIAMDKSINGANPTNPSADSLRGGVQQLTTGANALNSQTGTLKAGIKELANGAKTLDSQTGKLKSGIKLLANGSTTLNSGLKKLYDSGIQKIVKLYKKYIKDIKDLTKDAKELEDLLETGKKYNTFSKIAPNMDGNVKFIIKTEVDK